MDPIDAMTNRNIRNVRVKLRLNRETFNKFESRKICVAGYQCDNSDFDFCIAEHELPVIKTKTPCLRFLSSAFVLLLYRQLKLRIANH